MLNSHHYQTKLLEALLSGKLAIEPGQYKHVEIRHDDWCGIFKGERCNCEPDIVGIPGRLQDARP